VLTRTVADSAFVPLDVVATAVVPDPEWRCRRWPDADEVGVGELVGVADALGRLAVGVGELVGAGEWW
jgi:hypothetical protein